MKQAEIFIDGASKGNPGPAGIGVIICQDGGVLKNISVFIGDSTNNVAEYTALIYALQEALIMKVRRLVINSDSQLLCRQIKGEYKVRTPHILSLFRQAKHLLSGFEEFVINNIPRTENLGADKLANIAIKKKQK